jgi:hypothetical protein
MPYGRRVIDVCRTYYNRGEQWGDTIQYRLENLRPRNNSSGPGTAVFLFPSSSAELSRDALVLSTAMALNV